MKLPLSRNRGIKESSGKFITFLDSDDEYEKDHLLKRIEYMNAHPEVDLIHGGVEIIGNEYVRDKDNPDRIYSSFTMYNWGYFLWEKRRFYTIKRV